MVVSQLLRVATPVLPAVMLLAPVIAILMSGRDLEHPETLDPGQLTATTEWVLRFMTLGALGLSLLLIGERSLQRDRGGADMWQLALLGGFLAYFAGNALLPGLFGADTGLPRPYFYVLAVFLALYARREDGVAQIVDVLKWTLLLFMVLSMIYAPFRPNAALNYYAAELRLPVVPFRFWGLGSSPNTLGPMALVLILATIVRPFGRRWLTWTSHGVAGLVVLLAQSQTTWIATALIVPALLAYRAALASGRDLTVRVPTGFVLGAAGCVAGLAVLGAAYLLASGGVGRVVPTSGLTGYSEFLTGRGNIWRVALDLFQQHPIFGYGLSAWTLDFRTALSMPYATSAHNQVLQAMSVGGAMGLVGLLAYLAALIGSAWRHGWRSGGLAPALLALMLLRSLTETPFEMGTFLVADLAMQATLFALLVDRKGLGAPSDASLPVRLDWGDATSAPAVSAGPPKVRIH
jgi:O-antigen ligase